MGQKWPISAHMPIYGHTFFGHNSVIFHPISNFKISLRPGEWYLPVEHHKSWVGCFFNGFGILGPKMGVAARLAPKGLGPQNSTKKLPHWMNLSGQPLSRNHVFGNLGHEPPPLKILVFLSFWVGEIRNLGIASTGPQCLRLHDLGSYFFLSSLEGEI